MSQLACTADMSDPNNPTIIDETACAAAQDSESQPCVWCDATATLGQGLCAGASQKAMLSMFWDSICADSSGSDNTDGGKDKAAPPTPPAPIVPVPVTTPAPTPNPTPNPTAPTPDPPSGDDPMACTMDGQTPIQDEAACEARDDPAGGKCAWCEIKLIGGGACSTAQAKAQLSWMCKSEEEEAAAKAGNLRGDKDGEGGGGGFKNVDISCLSDQGGCATKMDSKGKPCVWCELGALGICATPDQAAAHSFLTCGSGAEGDGFVPVHDRGHGGGD